MLLAGQDLLLAIVVIAAGAVVQGVSGVGGGFIMVPFIAMIDMRLLPGAFIFSTLSLSSTMAWRERSSIDFANTLPMFITMLPGALLGAWLLTRVAPDHLGLIFGAMILLAVVITATGVHLPLNRLSSAMAGLIAGTMAASSAIGAPVVAVLYQRESGPRIRATLAYIYTVSSVLIVVALALSGRFAWQDAQAGLLLVPGFMLGYIFSRPLAMYFDHGATRYIVLGVSATAALFLITSSL